MSVQNPIMLRPRITIQHSAPGVPRKSLTRASQPSGLTLRITKRAISLCILAVSSLLHSDFRTCSRIEKEFQVFLYVVD